MMDISVSAPSRQAVITLLACVFLLFSLTTPVMAQDGDTSDWNTESSLICGDTDAANDTQVVFQYIIGIFMIMGFVFGILMYAASKFEDSVMGEEHDILGDIDGNNALRKAVMLPIVVYFFDFISGPVFGLDISCIVPSL